MLAVGEEIAIRMWNVAGGPQVNLLPRQSFFSFFSSWSGSARSSVNAVTRRSQLGLD